MSTRRVLVVGRPSSSLG